MDERAIDRTQSWMSDTQAMGLYSTLLFVVIALFPKAPPTVAALHKRQAIWSVRKAHRQTKHRL
jgi:hypothetical protein